MRTGENRRVWRVGMCAALALALALTGCSPSKPVELEEVTIQLSWFHDVEFAGIYVAEAKGFYAEQGLKVEIVMGGPTVDALAEVLSGRADFGIMTGDQIIRARAAGNDVVAISSIFRQSPLIVMALADSGIRRPEDLVGKTVGVISPNLDTTWDIQFMALLRRLGIDHTSMTFVPTQDYFGANELTSGRVDAASSFFVTNEPVQARIDGIAVAQFFYSDYGIVSYANPIFTTGELIAQNPDLVQRFVRATLKGYQYAIEHPEEAATITGKYDEGRTSEVLVAAMQAQIPLIDTGDVPIGWMDDAVWGAMQKVLLEQGILSAAIDWRQAYTNQFVSSAQ